MSESDELFTAVNYIKHKVDALERIELLNLRANKTLLEEYKKALLSDNDLLTVYKLIDGEKSQKNISDVSGIIQMTVSRKINILEEIGLIEIKNMNGKAKIYKHSVAEQAFKLTRLKYE
jgi:DNA-binding MarR family transcriptional regulator